jgi:hypothetical protein
VVTVDKLYKVVRVDNYARDTVADKIVAERLDASDAAVICEQKQVDAQRGGDDWYVIKDQDARLWGGWAEFV